jgi:hypothetical protein
VPPIVAPTGGDLGLVVGVEGAGRRRPTARTRAACRQVPIWEEREASARRRGQRAYVVDRVSSRILFAPAAGAGAIGARRIRGTAARRSEGNVAAGRSR